MLSLYTILLQNLKIEDKFMMMQQRNSYYIIKSVKCLLKQDAFNPDKTIFEIIKSIPYDYSKPEIFLTLIIICHYNEKKINDEITTLLLEKIKLNYLNLKGSIFKKILDNEINQYTFDLFKLIYQNLYSILSEEITKEIFEIINLKINVYKYMLKNTDNCKNKEIQKIIEVFEQILYYVNIKNKILIYS